MSQPLHLQIKQYLYLPQVQIIFSHLLGLKLLGTLLPTRCQQSRSEPSRECRRWMVDYAAAATILRPAAWTLLVQAQQFVGPVLARASSAAS